MNDIIIKTKLYYKKSDMVTGEGFYPIIREINNVDYDFFMINFVLKHDYINKNYFWYQMNGNVIMGFEDDNGLIILNKLNRFVKDYGIEPFSILNSGGRIVFPTTYNSTYRILKETYTID